MKLAFKVVLVCLLVATVGLAGFAVVANALAEVKPEMKALFDLALDLNFYWGYALFAIAILATITAFVFNVVTNPAGIGKMLAGLGIVAVVVGAPAIFVWKFREILPVPNSAGGVFDDTFALRISETGLFITYIVAGLALLAVVIYGLNAAIRKIVK